MQKSEFLDICLLITQNKATAEQYRQAMSVTVDDLATLMNSKAPEDELVNKAVAQAGALLMALTTVYWQSVMPQPSKQESFICPACKREI